MATISTPVRAYLASPVGGTAMGQSASLTVDISVSGYEANVPFLGIQPNTTSLSAGWECYAYRSADAGATYETVASVPMSFARSPNTLDRKPLRVEGGYWLLRIQSGGGVASTFSFQIGTIEHITAQQNV
jgi:hypothetical protein